MSSFFGSLFNRRNGDEAKVNDPNAVQVTIEKTTYSIPVAAVREIVQTAVRETLEQVLPALLASQRRSPFESPFRSRSPFGGRSPFEDDEDEGVDLGTIIAMAMAARAREESNDGMPASLAEALRSMRERMNGQQDDEDDEDEGPILTPEEVVAAYKARDFSNKRAELAFAVLATWDDDQSVIMRPELGLSVCMAAPGLVRAYKAGERYCSNCDGEDGCPVQLAFDTLVEYEQMQVEEAAWAEHDAQNMADTAEESNVAEPMMAGTVSSPEEVAAD